MIAINELVIHTKHPEWGIGCIAKQLQKRVKVNFGRDDVQTCNISDLQIVDTHMCETVPFRTFQMRIMSDKSTLNKVIVGNEVMEYVGIGWTSQGVVTMKDLTKYPRVI